jgi:hypothetical protein
VNTSLNSSGKVVVVITARSAHSMKWVVIKEGHEASVPSYTFDYQILLYPNLDLLITFSEATRFASWCLEVGIPKFGMLMRRTSHLHNGR